MPVAGEKKDVEPYLTVGCPMVFHLGPAAVEAPRCPTVVHGWRKAGYILLDRPRIGGRTAGMIRQARGFDRMAVFLFGGRQPGLEQEACAAGVSAYFRANGIACGNYARSIG